MDNIRNDTDLSNNNETIVVTDIVFSIYYYGSYSLLTVVNIIGNSFVIAVIIRHEKLREPHNYFMVSLAFSDLLVGVAYPLYNLTHLENHHIQAILGKYKLFKEQFELIE